jgi:hypothetical protein
MWESYGAVGYSDFLRLQIEAIGIVPEVMSDNIRLEVFSVLRRIGTAYSCACVVHQGYGIWSACHSLTVREQQQVLVLEEDLDFSLALE